METIRADGSRMEAAHRDMIVEAFNSQTYVDNRMDVQHEPIYDAITIAAAANVNETATSFFTNVAANTGKTLADTNLRQNGRLPSPEAFSIFAIRLRWREDLVIADAYALLDGFAFELRLGRKAYNTGPIWQYNCGGGLNAVTTANATTVLSNGTVTREAMHKLAIPIVIENNMDFDGRLVGTQVALAAAGAGGTGLRLMCLLDGLHARGVQ